MWNGSLNVYFSFINFSRDFHYFPWKSHIFLVSFISWHFIKGMCVVGGLGGKVSIEEGSFVCVCVCVWWVEFFSLSYCSREVMGFYWISLILLNLILFGFIDIWLYRVQQLLEKAMATHSTTLAWKIPWMEESGRLQSMRSLRVEYDWATSLSLFTFMHWRRKWQPTPVFLPGESQGQWSLVGCRLWGCTESDMTEAT